jgi:hypothetical protein
MAAIGSTVIDLPAASFAAIADGFMAPVSGGLIGWYFHGGTLEKSLRNLAGGLAATQQGAVSIGENWIRATPLINYIQTNHAETADMTLLSVFRTDQNFASAAARPIMVSNYTGSPSRGFSLYVPGASGSTTPATGLLRNTVGYAAGVVNASLTVPDMTRWTFAAGTVQAGVGQSIYNMTTGQKASVAEAAGATRNIGDQMFRIGSSYSTNFVGPSDIAFTALYSRALSAAEIDKIYQFMKGYFARRSMAI